MADDMEKKGQQGNQFGQGQQGGQSGQGQQGGQSGQSGQGQQSGQSGQNQQKKGGQNQTDEGEVHAVVVFHFRQRDDGGPFLGWGRGRAWPLLTGERGHYELAAGRDPRPYLQTMERLAAGG